MADDRLQIIVGDCRKLLATLPAQSVHCCVTSPPYWGLRDYGHGDQIGLEATPQEYVETMRGVFAEVRRVLRDDGTLWLNLGDSYAGAGYSNHTGTGGARRCDGGKQRHSTGSGFKPKDLVGIPWRVAFALQADGWYLRSDIIWCLSGGTWVYARTQKGDMPMTIKDLYRLKPETVQLWNGRRWTELCGISKTKRVGEELEIVLRSGERISCTPTHKFPTNRGLLEAEQIHTGDVIETTALPEPNNPKRPDCIRPDAAWFAGLYIAEGSRSGDCIQIAGNAKESTRWEHVRKIAEAYGGSATCTIDGNCQNIRVYGKVLNAILDEFVTGRTAKDKGFAPVAWRYGNDFIAAMVNGYLSGDGHYEPKNERWRLGFTRNYNLERDLRTACARLGYSLVLKLAHVPYNGTMRPTFRGELRKTRSGHPNEKPLSAVVEIRKARCREVYDLGVEDKPHLFALASGVLTHNSKPNPMPESVTDRPTKAHEFLFLLSKREKYWYDAEAIRENWTCDRDDMREKGVRTGLAYLQQETVASNHTKPRHSDKQRGHSRRHAGFNDSWDAMEKAEQQAGGRNKRTVWTVATCPYPEAHFATYPPNLIKPCILAGCPIGGTVLDPFGGSGTTGMVALELGRRAILLEVNPAYADLARSRCDVTPGLPLS